MLPILNNFLFYRLAVSFFSLIIFFIAYLSQDFLFFKTATIYTFFASLLSLGFTNHVRRNCFFIKTNIFRFLFLGLLIIFSILPLLYKDLNDHLEQYNLAYILFGLTTSHILSLIAFDNFVHNSSRGLKYIFIDCFFLFISYAILVVDYLNKNADYYIFFILFFLLRVIYLTNIEPKSLNHKIHITGKEIIFAALNAFFATFPMIVVTSISFNDVSVENEIGLWILRLISFFSVLIISYFNFSKSKNMRLNESLFITLFIFTSSIVFLSFLAINYVYDLNDIVIAFLPLIVLFGIWAKQNIQFKKGSMPILTFNFLLTFCVLLLLFFESASFLYFTAYYIFYGISINFYFRYKVL